MPSIMAIVGRIPAITDIMSTDLYTSTTKQKTDKLVTKIRLKLNKMNRKWTKHINFFVKTSIYGNEQTRIAKSIVWYW